MKTTDGLRPAYNVQITVDSANQVIVAAERQGMIERLSTPEGRELYSLRQQTVEPVFGDMKWNMGLSRFSLGSIEGAKSETWIVCIAHNLKVYGKSKGKSLFGKTAEAIGAPKTRSRILVAVKVWG
jgi:hypothetical protein